MHPDSPVGQDSTAVEEPLPSFDPRVRDDFEGLTFLGALTKTFTWAGHKFVIRTLTTGEMLEVAEIAARWAQTIGAGKAYQAATVAACLRLVDGQPLAVPITNGPLDTPLASRFTYVCDHWFPPTTEAVYNHFLELDERVQQVVAAMGEASGQTGP